MLTPETIGRIQREHLIKGKTIREIARGLKLPEYSPQNAAVGWDHIRVQREVQPRPKLGRWMMDLEVFLAVNAARRRASN
jgi:hypothetical protein